MSQKDQQGKTTVTEELEVSILDQAINATKQTEKSRAQELIQTLAAEAMKGTVKWNKNISLTLSEAIKEIDTMMSKQLSKIMHHDEFQKLEGSWRGLSYLIKNTSCSTSLKIKMLQMKKKEASRDLAKASDFDQSYIFKKIYEEEFGTPGGEPYGTLIGDYEISNLPEDIDFVKNMSHVAAAAFCPFVTSPAPGLFGFNDWTELSKPRDLEKVFDSAEYAGWNSFRQSEDARFVTMTMPRVLSRRPYGANTEHVEAFNYEEFIDHNGGEIGHEHYTWMNSAYVLGVKMTTSFNSYGFCTAIRGYESGGKVENLPTHVFKSDEGDVDMKCPTEIAITDRREAELGRLGFFPLSHYKNTDYAVFFGGQTVQKPKVFDDPDATSNASLSARMPYIMATSRFAHYMKVMARDKVGSFTEAKDMESWLNSWIMQYVNANAQASGEFKAQRPLAEAKIVVEEIPGMPGSFNAITLLRPWMQFEELTSSMRLVAKLPAK